MVALPDPQHGERRTQRTTRSGGATTLRAAVAAGGFSVTLIDGVTGSGKTEVYFEAVAAGAAARPAGADPAARDRAHRVVPRALRGSLRRAPGRVAFGCAAAHAASECWRQVATGEVRVVAGARSALFLPFRNSG